MQRQVFVMNQFICFCLSFNELSQTVVPCNNVYFSKNLILELLENIDIIRILSVLNTLRKDKMAHSERNPHSKNRGGKKLMYRTAEPSNSKPRWKSMFIHQGWFTALYTQHLLDLEILDEIVEQKYSICSDHCRFSSIYIPSSFCLDTFFYFITININIYFLRILSVIPRA